MLDLGVATRQLRHLLHASYENFCLGAPHGIPPEGRQKLDSGLGGSRVADGALLIQAHVLRAEFSEFRKLCSTKTSKAE